MSELYSPVDGSTVTVSATATAAQATFANSTLANHMVLSNLGPNYGYFRYGIGSVTANVNDAVLQPYHDFYLTYKQESTISAVCDSGLSAIFKATQYYGS